MADTPLPPIDYAASPTLTALRDVAGEEVVAIVVAKFGGNWVHVPIRPTARSELVAAVGMKAAQAIIDYFGGGTPLRIPTGRGHGHGRRIDHAEVVRLAGEGWGLRQLAQHFACTERNILKIKAANRPLGPARMPVSNLPRLQNHKAAPTVMALTAKGLTALEIGRRLGLSRDQIEKIKEASRRTTARPHNSTTS